jgi:alpha-N-acetylglucosamine transferase
VFADRLRHFGSKADIVVLVTFANNMTELPLEDMKRITQAGLRLKVVDEFWERTDAYQDENFVGHDVAKDKSGMYNKIYVWSLIEYDWVQYFDADIMPISDMDAYFEKQVTTFVNGWMSPLQGGWYLLQPSMDVFEDLKKMVLFRYGSDWTPEQDFHVPHLIAPNAGNKPCLDDDQVCVCV